MYVALDNLNLFLPLYKVSFKLLIIYPERSWSEMELQPITCLVSNRKITLTKRMGKTKKGIVDYWT